MFVWRDFSGAVPSCQVVVDVVEVGVVGEEEEEGCSPTFYQAMVTGSVLIQGKDWYLACTHLVRGGDELHLWSSSNCSPTPCVCVCVWIL